MKAALREREKKKKKEEEEVIEEEEEEEEKEEKKEKTERDVKMSSSGFGDGRGATNHRPGSRFSPRTPEQTMALLTPQA
jgi:hypothetical protein